MADGPPTSTLGSRLRDAARVLTPYAGNEWQRGPQRVDTHYVYRMLLLVAVLACDVVLALLIGRVDFIRPGLGNVFWFTNVAPMALDLVISAVFLRRWGPSTPYVLCVCVLLEVCAAVAWVQETGSVSSYFLCALLGMPIMYRAAYSYWISLVATLGLVTGLLLCFVLENQGSLPYASLFRDGALTAPPVAYRQIAMVSLVTAMVLSFILSHGFVMKWHRSMQALADVKLRLAEAEQKVELGRLSGTMLGNYELSDLLGRGGMGEVYAARDGRGREVAVKLLHAHLGDEPVMRARLRRESDVVRRMPSGTVAGLIEHGTSPDGHEYIVMERLRGEDLGALLKRQGSLPAVEAMTILRGIARALDGAHALGVVHRDLKPPNVFVCNRPRADGAPDVRLLDFGVARLLDASSTMVTAHGGVLGTPGYFAPEQATGQPLSPATDVFALACIAYRALTGDVAFTARQPAAALRQILVYQPRPASRLVDGLPAAVDDVLAVALAVEPSQRQASAMAFVDELDRVLAGGTIDGLAARAGRARRALAMELDPTMAGNPALGDTGVASA